MENTTLRVIRYLISPDIVEKGIPKEIKLSLPKGGLILTAGLHGDPFNDPDIENVFIWVLGDSSPECEKELRKFVLVETKESIDWREGAIHRYIGTFQYGLIRREFHVFEERESKIEIGKRGVG